MTHLFRSAILLGAGLTVGLAACPGPGPVVPNVLVGRYHWRNLVTPIAGTLTVVPDSIEGARDTLRSSEGGVLLCQRLNEPRCPIRCETGSRTRAWSVFCFDTRSRGDGFDGSFQSCVVREVPVRRRVVNPRTGQVTVVRDLVRRPLCRDAERLDVERLD